MRITKKGLRILAAVIWYIGGIVLTIKGMIMLNQAYALNPILRGVAISFASGVIVGLIKARFIFTHALKKNLKRIEGLPVPTYVWQCYRLGFFIFLGIVITLSKYLTEWAAGDYIYLSLVGILDLSIATALLTSSVIYWRR